MRSLLIVDDDEVSREILTEYARSADYRVLAAASGDAALSLLHSQPRKVPDVILADVRMEGTCGEELARHLRCACGPTTRLIAMSANRKGPEGFDAYLRKPFTTTELKAAIDGPGRGHEETEQIFPRKSRTSTLDETTYAALQQSITATKLLALYELCLEDTIRRLGRMRKALYAGQPVLFADEAHAMRGSCGFVGALELARLAAAMQRGGLHEALGASSPLDLLNESLAECEALRLLVLPVAMEVCS